MGVQLLRCRGVDLGLGLIQRSHELVEHGHVAQTHAILVVWLSEVRPELTQGSEMGSHGLHLLAGEQDSGATEPIGCAVERIAHYLPVVSRQAAAHAEPLHGQLHCHDPFEIVVHASSSPFLENRLVAKDLSD